MREINTKDYAPKLSNLEAGIADARNAIYQQALSIAEEFHETRMRISEGFSNIFVQVRSRQDGRSIHIGWSIFHSKNGFKRNAVSMRKRRGAHYDLATIQAASPEWLKQLATDTEMRLRPLRDSLERLTEMERALRVIDARLCNGTALKPAPTSEPEGEAANDDADLEAQVAERF